MARGRSRRGLEGGADEAELRFPPPAGKSSQRLGSALIKRLLRSVLGGGCAAPLCCGAVSSPAFNSRLSAGDRLEAGICSPEGSRWRGLRPGSRSLSRWQRPALIWAAGVAQRGTGRTCLSIPPLPFLAFPAVPVRLFSRLSSSSPSSRSALPSLRGGGWGPGALTPASVSETGQPQGRAAPQGPQPPGPAARLLQNGAGRGPDAGGSHGDAGNGLFRPLPSSQKPHRKLQSHHSINSQGSKKSKGSSKSASSHIPIEAQEDCCVHCILSCLFCEFLTLCNIVLDCATCGSCTSEDSCICCCCCNSGECADCDLPCDMDCGIIDACCESADCLEICMECCGLCFSS
uniref:MyoD family inhibitor n=1 Tax=Apteryx owenii TaxID=8824 RepID=A0A8B9QIN0_APTOW